MPKFAVEWKATNSNCVIPTKDGIALCSSRRPLDEAKRWLGTLPKSLSVESLTGAYAILGLGGGFHIAAFAERYPQNPIFVFDFDLELRTGFHRHFPSQRNIEILIGAEIDDFLKSFKVESFAAILSFQPALLWHENRFRDLSQRLLGPKTTKSILAEKDKLDERSRILWDVLGEMVR